jgi:zinc protease
MLWEDILELLMMRLLACLSAALVLCGPAAQAQIAKVQTARAQTAGTRTTAPASAIVVPPLKYETRTLANGLKVVTALDHGAPIVTVQVFYGVGSKDDPEGRSGFAHLFEHMMFKATRDMPAEYMDRLTEDVGGMNNASTADDFTNFYEVIPSNHLERLLWAEAERMTSLEVDEANFKSERQVVEEELRQRVLADPYGRFQALAIPENSFTVHPYKRPGIGSIADLDAASLDDVRAFHATYYRPDDALLIVVGDFDPATLDAWIDRYFAPIKAPAAPLPRVTVKEPPRTGPKTVTTYGPNVPLPAVAITWLAPAASDPDDPALTVLDAILTGGDSARLNESLVYRQQIAQTVFSSADTRQQPGLFYVGAVMADGKTPDDGEKALLAELAKLRDAPVGAAELDKAKTLLIAQALRSRETVDGRGYAIGNAQWVEGDVSRVNDDIGKIQAVTADDVRRVARAYLPDDRRVTIRYVSETQRPAGEAAREGVATPSKPSAAVVAKAPTVAAPPPAAPAGGRTTAPDPGPPAKPNLPVAAERLLPNGLRVIVAQSTSLPLVTAQLTIKTGGAAESAAKAGLADMTASLLTQGAGQRSATDIARDIEALGAHIDASAGWDGSRLDLDVVAGKLPAAMSIFAEVARRPTFAPEELDRLRQRTLDSLQVELQEPGNLARFAAADAVFAGTPYGHVLTGTPDSLKGLTRADVATFHRTWYRPDNAVLVLTGDITPEAGFALAAQAFGDWAGPAAPLPATPLSAPTAQPRVIVIDLPGTGQAAVSLYLQGIKRSDPRYYPVVVANSVLGGGYSARLNEEVRVKRGLSYGANSVLDARRGIGPIAAAAQTKNESAPEVVEVMLAELGRLGAAPPEAVELAARKAALAGNFGRSVATTGGLAGYLSGLALQGLDPTEINRYASSVEAVTADQVQAVARQVFDPKAATIVVVGDAKLFADKLKAKYPTAEVIPADKLNLDSALLR